MIMEKIVTPRRMTTAQTLLFTGEPGEITIDTDKETAVIHDGVHAGGFPLARENLSNTLAPMLEARGIARADLSNVAQAAIAVRGIAKNDMGNVSADSMALRGVMKADCSNGTGMASCDAPGLAMFATLDEALAPSLPPDAGSKALSLACASALVQEKKGLPRGYITGYAMEFVSDTQVSFGAGAAKSLDDTIDLISKDPIVKNVDAQWEQGSGFGAMLPGTARAADTQYYAFVIKSGLTGVLEILFDTAPDGANISECEQVRDWCGGTVRLRSVGRFATGSDGSIRASSVTSHRADSEIAAHIALPSDRSLTLPLLGNSAAFTAPANGYYSISFNRSSSGATYYYAYVSYGAKWIWTNSLGAYCGHFIPLAKGQRIDIVANVGSVGAMSQVEVRFIYSNGEI
jgi:hypothetical protein